MVVLNKLSEELLLAAFVIVRICLGKSQWAPRLEPEQSPTAITGMVKRRTLVDEYLT
ncbi:hypothetical protein SAMN05192566_2403 [Methylophilus rhizosphaerae]|uniref:Uncharacterized protein n=1 Tax=Methylophilus rhizosphaerae TaxID=492660 RepID=A0A1G9EQY7_9PROT|nr:hypothetical protein SAMN05192566_2403 [Methylophilus rhizosphaerae]